MCCCCWSTITRFESPNFFFCLTNVGREPSSHLHARQVHPEADVRVKLDLLARTRMVDFAKEEHARLGVEAPASLAQRRPALIAEHKALAAKTAELRKVLEEMPGATAETLAAKGVPAGQVEELLRFARFQFDAGNYSQAGEYLAAYRTLSGSEDVGVAWGKLAADILLQDWASAQEQLGRVREVLDKTDNAALQLTQRAWLLHWALFVFLSQPDGAGRFLDLALSETFLNVVQTTCPHLLRYIVAAFVVAPAAHRRTPLRELVRVVEQERPNYSDAVTRFLHALCVEYDFEAALEQLALAEELVKDNYFLHSMVGAFVEQARVLVFRSYCKIHQSIDLTLLQSKLGTASVAQAESYIVNLIRNEQDAKIDSATNQIIFSPSTSPAAVYQKIVEKTQALTTQTALLQAQLSRQTKR